MELYKISPVRQSEKMMFIKHAIDYFTELNENFVPIQEFKNEYFESIKKAKQLYLVWLLYKNEKVGFSIYGIEKHRFLNKKIGKIYDFYIFRNKRRNDLGNYFSKLIISELKRKKIEKIELEVIINNKIAFQFWKKQSFKEYSIKFYLK